MTSPSRKKHPITAPSTAAATALDRNGRREAGGQDGASAGRLFTLTPRGALRRGIRPAIGATLAIASLFALALCDTAGAADGKPTPAAPHRNVKTNAVKPLRRPGTAQRAHSTQLRWAPYRTTRGTSGTPGQFAKYGREGDREANRENIARRQPTFGDDGNGDNGVDAGNGTQPGLPSIDDPAGDLPGPFDLPTPDSGDDSPLPGPGDSPFPGLDAPSDDSSPGLGVGPAPYGDDLAQGSRFELGPCPTIEDLDPIGILDDRIDPDTSGAMPPECGLGDREFKGRNWTLTTFTWKASAICHKPLYFEQMALERYGHSCHPLVEPFVSGAHFFVTIPVLPYKMGMDPPWECQYPLGYYRPGNCAPHLKYPIPLSVRGALTEVGVVTGLVFILP
jgi:hypothetical protein